MKGFIQHLGVTLRLYSRNKMALFYSYLFPLIFLASFAVYYQNDLVPLRDHLGEILTVAILGGACFGLPTTMVSERERGVWRRYRLAPIPTRSLIASTAIARYFTLITAGLLQIALAIGVAAWMRAGDATERGESLMNYLPIPEHPFQLFIAFTFVTYAFIGLGLVMAMLADNVPAVQALGQCIFLPMLIVGGVAVKLSGLGPTVQHISNFFPGRYAVEALEVCVRGDGLVGPVKFSLLALFLIGTAGCIAGSKMFRWDAQQRFVQRGGKRWIGAALAAWVLVGVLAESKEQVNAFLFGVPVPVQQKASEKPKPKLPGGNFNDTPPNEASPAPDASAASTEQSEAVAQEAAPTRPAPKSWKEVTDADIDGLRWDAPPDDGIVSPMAKVTADPGTELIDQIMEIKGAIADWAPAKEKEKDPIQHVRNLLYVAATPDILQVEIEPYVPIVVLSYLRDEFNDADLSKILCWIVMHPMDGEVAAADKVSELGIDFKLTQPLRLRERTYYYAQKFLARTAGKIKEE